MGCLPGSTSRPSTPTTAPIRIALITPVMVMSYLILTHRVSW